MPGWHERTAELREQGLLTVVGLIQEQHADRCRLFMQWKQMEFPVMVDSLDQLGVSAVPITLLIDEDGVVVEILGRGTSIAEVESFARAASGPPRNAPAPSTTPNLDELHAPRTVENLLAHADRLVMWGGDERLTEAIETYQELLFVDPKNGDACFHLGVAFLRRFESEHRRTSDFASAIEAWKWARRIDPNQYIWRRRIQQYGPRLDKPYSFYDWVIEARRDIAARGETPTALSVEPGGAEFADRSRDPLLTPDSAEPDPDDRITHDDGYISVEGAVVPHTDGGAAWRVHLLFAPQGEAHWNNEAESMQVWIDVPEGWSVDQRLVELSNPTSAVSDELRSAAFELRPTGDAGIEGLMLRGYALFNVCENDEGVCLYRRLDFALPLDEEQR